ncbi:glycosyltransferase family 4 protein [Anabaena sp. UHCC 0451]|uniref:glycosyltransferase family 4 protein n=1 Tax=Anabaena sp. UHCC 0451 TaxID=2055235 RepID=UPI002B1F1B2F|nr:glycosyltransferase [Anabaena sp. UHCC 0451]MEA5579048.1 glycosyltransferase [Anabaena sp. UHCC 0451]
MNNKTDKILICHLITGLNTGGAERMLYNLLSKSNRELFSPIVISLMDRGTFGDRIESLGIPVHSIGMKQGIPTPATLLRLVQTIRCLKPDVIQGWMYHGNLAAFLAGLFLSPKVPVFWSIHFSISSLNSEKLMTQAVIRVGANISHFVSQNIFVSKNSRIQHEQIGYSSTNSCVIPNATDTSVFKPSQEARLKLRTDLGLAKETILIGIFARYHPMKDHANFLQSAKLLHQKFSPVHFLLAGCNIDEKNKNLQNLIQEVGIVSQVHLLGERQDIPYIASALDIFSLSSAYGEAFPLVIGEAMSCGVPCVVTDVGDSAWIVGDTGKVVPPQNPQLLANAFQELIDLGSQGREILGKAARERVINLFSLDSVVPQYESFYENLLPSQK